MLTDARLRDAVVALVVARTARPFAAVYPVAQGVLAVTDGAWIQPHHREPLHRDVAAALVSGGGSPEVTWLLVDVNEPSLRGCESLARTRAARSRSVAARLPGARAADTLAAVGYHPLPRPLFLRASGLSK